MGAATASPTRLSKADRREHLLDIASEILVKRGRTALTMEGLAERAGVSKALPYAHFDNADGVLIALHKREIDLLGRRVFLAVEKLTEPEVRVSAAIHAYFDVVVERGRILAALSTPVAGPASESSGRTRIGVDFVSLLLIKPYGFSGRQAKMLAAMFLGTLSGATESWAHGDGGRDRIEQTTTAVIVGGLRRAREQGVMR